MVIFIIFERGQKVILFFLNLKTCYCTLEFRGCFSDKLRMRKGSEITIKDEEGLVEITQSVMQGWYSLAQVVERR